MTPRGDHQASEASERAIEAARAALSQNMDAFEAAAEALDAAHDPALGLDRSVRLGWFIDWLSSWAAEDVLGFRLSPGERTALERKFTESSTQDKEE